MMRIFHKRLADAFLVLCIAVVLLSGCSVLLVSAAGDLARLVDRADLLTENEESELLRLLDSISERQQVDIVVVTVDSLEGKTAEAYADDFYDHNGYGFGDEQDGVLLLISMGERVWHISTSGYGITAFTDAGLEYISDAFVEDLSIGDYAAAFTNFANLCDAFITQANTGEPYDVDNMPKEPFEPGWTLLTTLIIAFVISLIVTGTMKGQLKTVYSQSGADNYIQQGSMRLTRKNDLFLYRHVDRRKRVESSSSSSSRRSGSGGSTTHTSSSGKTHGGSGGKF